MNKELVDSLVQAVSDSNTKQFNDFMEKELIPKMDEVSAKNARTVVERMLTERFVRGRDVTGLSDEQKKDFAKQVKSVFGGDRSASIRVKANEALIEEQDNRGRE